MNEQVQLKAFLVTLFIVVVMGLSQAVSAAYFAVPTVPGYSASSGTFSAASGAYSTAANGASYGASGIVNVAGKSITVPATLRMAANAGAYAKSAMSLTPLGLVGTLAAGYLLEQAMTWDPATNSWVVPKNIPFTGTCISPLTTTYCGTSAACTKTNGDVQEMWTAASCGAYSNYGSCASYGFPDTKLCFRIVANYVPGRPATPEDWEALPDPLPAIAPELPHAPYMPEGVPVNPPEYDFPPVSIPVGEPYTKPDGSTVQPTAQVSPNGDGVTIDTFDQPLTDSTGAPVPPNTPPVDTPEPVPPPPTDCDKYPNSIGCSEYGVPPASDVIPTHEVPVSTAFSPVGGNGSCPADVSLSALGSPITWSYGPICGFAETIRPLVIGFAWLSFGFTVVSGFRKA